MRDLSIALARAGHQPTVITSAPDLGAEYRIDFADGVQILRLTAPHTKTVGYVARTLAECWTPWAMLRTLAKSPLSADIWDGVVWYSPSIFLGPVANALKRKSNCSGYLIVRDIFPEWAVDMGLMRRGLPYAFFKAVSKYQYSVANTIGVQTRGNGRYFVDWVARTGGRLEVLQNWLAAAPISACSISVRDTPLAGRKIFVYAGNMGVAQGMDILLELASRFQSRLDVGFLFVGRGSDSRRLKMNACLRGLSNVLFYDEIDPDEIPGLYAQCHVGLMSLDARHKSHNIPGKFLTYMQAGLPVLASINPGNDLSELVNRARVGSVCTNQSVDALRALADDLLCVVETDQDLSARCRALWARLFTPEIAVEQIVRALE